MLNWTFEGGTLTSDGGLLLLREVDQRLALLSRAAEIIPDPRSPDHVLHPQQELLVSRVFGIAAGYEDGNDHEQLRHDPAFQVAAEHVPAEGNYDEDQHPLASPATHSRFENRIDAKTNLRLHELLSMCFWKAFPKHQKKSSWIMMPPMIRRTVSSSSDTSMASTTAIAFYRCMFLR